MRSALATHDRILRSVIEAYDGYVFSTAGDTFCAAFSTPGRAVEAAVEAQDQSESATASGASPTTGSSSSSTPAPANGNSSANDPAHSRRARYLRRQPAARRSLHRRVLQPLA